MKLERVRWMLIAAALLGAVSCSRPPPQADDKTPRIKWEVSLGDGGEATPAIGDDGTIYVGNTHGLMAIAPDGTIRWVFDGTTTSMPAAGTKKLEWPRQAKINSFGPPTIARDGRIYVVTKPGVVYCLTVNGTLQWRKETGSFTDGVPPVVDGNGVLVMEAERNVQAMRAAEGTPLWRTYFGTKGMPVSIGGRLLIGGASGLLELSGEGQVSAQYKPHEMGGCGEPAVAADGTVFAVCADKKVHAFSPALQPLRDREVGHGNDFSGVVVSGDGSLYFTASGSLQALNADLSPKWTAPIAGKAATPILAQDRTVIVGGPSWRTLMAFDADGRPRWQFTPRQQLNGYPTLGSDGTIYVSAYPGTLYALEGGCGGLMSAPWPKTRGNVENSGTR